MIAPVWGYMGHRRLLAATVVGLAGSGDVADDFSRFQKDNQLGSSRAITEPWIAKTVVATGILYH